MSYCVSCGSSLPSGQKICSMRYGDPSYGSDNYYRDYIEDWLESDQRNREEENYGEAKVEELKEDLPF